MGSKHFHILFKLDEQIMKKGGKVDLIFRTAINQNLFLRIFIASQTNWYVGQEKNINIFMTLSGIETSSHSLLHFKFLNLLYFS